VERWARTTQRLNAPLDPIVLAHIAQKSYAHPSSSLDTANDLSDKV